MEFRLLIGRNLYLLSFSPTSCLTEGLLAKSYVCMSDNLNLMDFTRRLRHLLVCLRQAITIKNKAYIITKSTIFHKWFRPCPLSDIQKPSNSPLCNTIPLNPPSRHPKTLLPSHHIIIKQRDFNSLHMLITITLTPSHTIIKYRTLLAFLSFIRTTSITILLMNG